MIVVRIIGGLGNQMFQYAVARHLAHRRHEEFLLDVSGFDEYKLHEYSLKYLRVIENKAPDGLTAGQAVAGGRLGFLRRFLAPRPVLPIIKEEIFSFDPKMLDLAGDVYLDGYWQSEKYFLDIRDILLAEFRPKELSRAAAETLRAIMDTNRSVSAHIRRGDYVTNKQTNQVHGTCGTEYYEQAARLLREQIGKPKFYVFSDDPEWVRENIRLGPETVYVDGNRNYEDMHLMSACRHNIIANSTFSWWGAWLNNNPDKVVVAPQKWFNQGGMDTKDLIPDSWTRI